MLFGALALVWPGVTLAALLMLLGAGALAASIRSEAGGDWWLAPLGLAGIAAGAVSFVYPTPAVLVLLFVMACGAIICGLFAILGAIALRKEFHDPWMPATAGVLSVIFGMALLTQPAAGILALVWMIAGYALLLGLRNVMFAWRRAHA
jgi:uncharacterized membrane protein HdeD (DUF308 family)